MERAAHLITIAKKPRAGTPPVCQERRGRMKSCTFEHERFRLVEGWFSGNLVLYQKTSLGPSKTPSVPTIIGTISSKGGSRPSYARLNQPLIFPLGPTHGTSLNVVPECSHRLAGPQASKAGSALGPWGCPLGPPPRSPGMRLVPRLAYLASRCTWARAGRFV